VSEDRSQQTEPATPYRLEQARKKGQIPHSRDVQSASALAAAWSALALGGAGALALRVGDVATRTWSAAARPPDALADFHSLLLDVGLASAVALAPLVGVIALAGIASSALQGGVHWHPELLGPRFERVSPLQGLKRIFNPERAIDLIKTLCQLCAAVAITWWMVSDDLPRLVSWLQTSERSSALATFELATSLAFALVGGLAPIAALDLLWQRQRHSARLRMSKQEVRDEAREREGDPAQRGRFRARHRTLSRSRMIAAVAAADVVIANPTHFAIALRYDPGRSRAPEVLAKGKDRVALRIREAAERHGVPIVEDKPLARVLHDACEIGRVIPENLFEAVAEVLAHVYRIAPERARRWRNA
jgi:flagellar biosynthetic protein FlhB